MHQLTSGFYFMWRSIIFLFFVLTGSLMSGLAQDADAPETPPATPEAIKDVYVIPIHGPIGKPTLYVVRRGIKDAIANGVDVIVIDMDTPGGRLDVTLEIMEMLNRFEGDTYTFVNNEAVSAGAFISVATEKIYFTEDGQIGAAEAVSGSGEDIPDSMKRKLLSYINAKVRVYTGEYRYRSDVMRAMTDPNFELKIDEIVLSPKDELLSLTAKEAITEYGNPPEKLLGEGIVESVEDLLTKEYGAGGYAIQNFNTSWSENLAQQMQSIVPIIMGLGLLLLFIEFKTPSFGVIGGIGIALIVLVFASNYIAGLAGYEALIVFFLGVAMIAVELFLLPGTVIIGFLGIAMIMFSLVWSLSDLWPTPDGGVTIDWRQVLGSSQTVILSTLGAILALLLIWKFLPKRILAARLVNMESSPQPSAVALGGAIRSQPDSTLPAVGSQGTVATDLHPLGTVKIDGEYYEAIVAVGGLKKGTPVQVVGYKQYSLLVEEIETTS